MTNRRIKLLNKLIGSATGEDEAKLYKLTIERICIDMCDYYYKFYHNDGPGAMVYVPTNEDEKKSMFYLTVNNLIHAVDDLNKNEYGGIIAIRSSTVPGFTKSMQELYPKQKICSNEDHKNKGPKSRRI